MMNHLRPSWLAAFALAMLSVQVASAEDASEDWGQLRSDVESSQDGALEARRQAIRERAKARFDAADTDGNGGLNKDEAVKLPDAIGEHFDLIDDNRDGLITERELAVAWKKHQIMRKRNALPPRRPLHRR